MVYVVDFFVPLLKEICQIEMANSRKRPKATVEILQLFLKN